MPTSSEFVALCRAQVALLSESLGASSSAVYLMEKAAEAEGTELVPIVTYPETAPDQRQAMILSLPPSAEAGQTSTLRQLAAESISEQSSSATGSRVFLPLEPAYRPSPPEDAESVMASEPADQVVLPLIHSSAVMGILVTVRDDRPWSAQERNQLEGIANTLAIARFLDQRSQWLESHFRHRQLLQSQQQDTFHDLLHQFRNPLTALRTFGKLLLKRLQPEDDNRKVAEGIVRESDRLRELLNQFDQTVDLGEADWVAMPASALPEGNGAIALELDTVAIDTASERSSQAPSLLPGAVLGTALHLSSCCVLEILEPLLISAAALAQEQGLTLKTDLPAPLPTVCADAKGLREILSNLIDNALKYGASGTQIYVRAGIRQPHHLMKTIVKRPKPGWYQGVVVADSGPGIPAQDLPRIFERHYRGVQAQTEIPGTGLGLAIARELIQQMQGSIQVFSPAATCSWVTDWRTGTPSGPGTAFVVWLPETGDRAD